MDLHLVRGDGSSHEKFLKAKLLRRFHDASRFLIQEYEGYLSVHAHPSEKKWVAAKALARRQNMSVDYASPYRMVSIDVRTKAEKLLLEAPFGEALRCPQWSPDGAKVAFWKGRSRQEGAGVYVYEIGTGSLRKVANIQTFFDACEEMATYLRWIDVSRLAIYHGMGEGIWLVDLMKATAEKIHDGKGLFISSMAGVTSKDFHANASKLNTEVVRALWGDLNNPQEGPYWSPSGTAYFYRRIREGFWAKGWIERYDLQSREQYKIKTLWWALYRE